MGCIEMERVRKSNDRLDALEPYDPRYLPAQVMLSANENPNDVDVHVRDLAQRRIRDLSLNRYPDPLANELRDQIAQAYGLERGNVLIGNGGDELLFDLFLAYGGLGRTFLNAPPTFSVYEYNAKLTGTETVNIPRLDDYAIDEAAMLQRLGRGDVDFSVITSPNNPTGNCVSEEFCVQMLDASDALMLVDEAYFEFSGASMRPYLSMHENLLILHTFSKAFSLAGVRVGYILGSKAVIDEFLKVRQPYSVDAVSQAIAKTVFENRAEFFWGEVEAIKARREKMYAQLESIDGVKVFPSEANYLLLRVKDAHDVWKDLLNDYSVLVRDFSSAEYLDDCLRVSIGTDEENKVFIDALRDILAARQAIDIG